MVTDRHKQLSIRRFREYWTACRRLMSGLTASLIMLLGLGSSPGCKVGPDFLAPKPPDLSATFGQSPDNAVDASGATCRCEADTWWASFNDNTLQELLSEANSQNLDIREAYFRIVESRARVGTVRADWFPQVGSSSDYTYRGISENAAQFVPQNQDGGGFSYHTTGLNSSWEIDLFGRIARNVEAANAELLSQQESLHDIRLILLADVATAYTQIRVLQQRLIIAKENLSLQQQTLKIVTSRENAGLVGQLDQTEAESNVIATQTSIPPIEFELQATLYRLAVLLGRTPSSDFQLADNYANLPVVAVEDIYPGAPAALLARRPDIRKANFDVMAANARIGAAVADRLPQLTIRGDVSVEARDISVLYSGGSLVHSVGPGFRWNLLNWGRLKSLVDARRAAHDQALLRYQAAVLKAVQEVESALFEYNRNQARVKDLERLVEVTRRSVDVSKLRYEQNLINFDRVLDAQRSLATAEGSLATARGDVILSLIRAYKALGGGWQNPPGGMNIGLSQVTLEVSDDTIVLPIESPYNTQPRASAIKPEELPVSPVFEEALTPEPRRYPVRTPPIMSPAGSADIPLLAPSASDGKNSLAPRASGFEHSLDAREVPFPTPQVNSESTRRMLSMPEGIALPQPGMIEADAMGR